MKSRPLFSIILETMAFVLKVCRLHLFAECDSKSVDLSASWMPMLTANW